MPNIELTCEILAQLLENMRAFCSILTKHAVFLLHFVKHMGDFCTLWGLHGKLLLYFAKTCGDFALSASCNPLGCNLAPQGQYKGDAPQGHL